MIILLSEKSELYSGQIQIHSSSCLGMNERPLPLAGAGALVNVSRAKYAAFFFFLEAVLLTIVEGFSWILLVVILILRYGGPAIAHIKSTSKQVAAILLPTKITAGKKKKIRISDSTSFNWINEIVERIWQVYLLPIA